MLEPTNFEVTVDELNRAEEIDGLREELRVARRRIDDLEDFLRGLAMNAKAMAGRREQF